MNYFKLHKDGYFEISDVGIGDLISSFGNSYLVEETQLISNYDSGKYSKTLTTEYGANAFPFHTDGAHRVIPPRWTILQFIGDGKSDTATLLFDSKVLSEIYENEDLFFNEIYLVKHGHQSFLTPIINRQLYCEPIFRWNKLVMKKLINKTGKTLEDYLSSFHVRITWNFGKILILDNWRMLHGREKILPNELHTRKIKRFNLTPINENAGI